MKIGIIGDYDGRPSHVATNEALTHCSDILNISIEITWVPTDSLLTDVRKELVVYDKLFGAPGSPYKSMLGALNGIQYARENNIPFLGTCGGFQHAVIEYGKNVLHIKELQKEDFDPYQPNSFITALTCSLVGQSQKMILSRESELAKIYGSSEIIEKYNCSFGLNKEFEELLTVNGFAVVGVNEEKEARIMQLLQNDFFVITLFQPQLSSTKEKPHPLLLNFFT